MVRFVLSAVAVARILAAQPAFAEHLAVTTSDRAQAAATAKEQPSPRSAAANAERGQDFAGDDDDCPSGGDRPS